MKNILFSGGLDSAVCLYSTDEPSFATFVSYGQPAEREEHSAANRIAMHFGCELKIIRITGLVLGDMLSTIGLAGPRVIQSRNALLLAAAVNLGGESVTIGCSGVDATDYPDCRPGFIETMDGVMRDAYGIGIRAPLLNLSPEEVLERAKELKVPLSWLWSCYTPKAKNERCGTCDACERRSAIGT